MVWRSAAVVMRSKSGSRVWWVKGSIFNGNRLPGVPDGAPTSVYPQPTSDPTSIPNIRRALIPWRMRPKPSTMKVHSVRSYIRRLRIRHRTIWPLYSSIVSLYVTQVYVNRKRYALPGDKGVADSAGNRYSNVYL